MTRSPARVAPRLLTKAEPVTIWCAVCKGYAGFEHDHRADNTGLDDGPFLPGHEPRKKAAPKSPEEMSAIRAKAWATRRARSRKETP